MEHFNLLNSPLEGTNLIEASAGTGKTYAITGLFLRFILEKNLSVNQILVVTFTEAATAELKDRIRGKLREAILAFSENQSKDILLDGLLKKSKDPTLSIRVLREALRTFDQAAIFTIHGLCRRILHENAFETGTLFDTELMTEITSLKAEIVEDFWRHHLYGASSLFVRYVLDKQISPASLLSLFVNRIDQPYLKIIPHLEMVDSSPHEEAFKACFKAVQDAWSFAKAEVEEILMTHQGLNRIRYKEADVPAWIGQMDHYMTSEGNDPVPFKGFHKFTVSELKRATRKNHAPPSHLFFQHCEALMRAQEGLETIFEKRLLGLKLRLFQYGRGELARKKAEKNIHAYEDLLLKVHQALAGSGGGLLQVAIRRKFRSALIDEFQDTDPVQYVIFSQIFAHQDSALFLIGDPKQAIYGFRGADIFSYMSAARDVASRYTLSENWRSGPELITAVNTLFSKAHYPFVHDEILFLPAELVKKRDMESLNLDGEPDPPMQLWFMDSSKFTDDGKAITKTQAREWIPRAVAGEISRLLHLSRNNKAFIGKRALREGDMAVLVRRNAEAQKMQDVLSALDIPSVLFSTANLFDSHEALEMSRLLAAVLEPNNERALKAALATDMLGLKGEEIDHLMEDSAGWERGLLRFREYHDLWNERGFIRMFRFFVRRENLLGRLMMLPGGERRCTNLHHLAEVLHQTSVEKRLKMTGLFKWLSEQRDPNTPRSEEHQLRLESDENAVTLVTIHKSKGLEYPIVFCPFLWDGSKMRRSKEPFIFHDERENMRLTLDLGSQQMDQNRASAENEQLAENLRLLYVALTRAKDRCYLVWGRFNGAETSAPAYLFHQPETWKKGNAVAATGERFNTLSDEDLRRELQRIQANAHGTIGLSDLPLGEMEAYTPSQTKRGSLFCRKFSGRIDRRWRISSFSSLVTGKPYRAELADRDETVQTDFEGARMEAEPSGIFAFPKGTRAGILLHDLMEHLDFKEGDQDTMKREVSNKLNAYGFEPVWEEALVQMVQRVLATPLDPEIKGFCLSRISNQDRINELEFYFPLAPLSAKKLRRIFAEHADPTLFGDFPEQIGRLDFSPTRGFMKGFIDMIFRYRERFYLLDWKSNHLGNRPEDYGREALAKEMTDRFYILQYHLYTVALDQYLQLRIPNYDYEIHFGGVYYLFLRGMNPEEGPDFGIYRDRPSHDLISELCSTLIE